MNLLFSLLLSARAHAETPLVVLHLDPGAASSASAGPEAGISGKLEFPIAFFIMYTAPAMVRLVTGHGSVDEVLTPSPPMSPEYLLFVNRGLDPGDPVEWGGGMGLRFHPLGTAAAYVPPARGLWIDANGRYGTRGWGFDSSLGWDLSLSEVVLLGPVVGVVREQGEWRKVASLSLSFSLNMEAIDGSDEP